MTGLRRDRRMGELAKRIDQPVERYRGLRPEALAMALYIGAQVRELSGQAPLVVTSTVRDGTYQTQLADRNREATRRYSLHTTGWAFDVLREYRSRRQALAFQFVLDRLRSLNAIAWVREPRAIHITAASDAERAASAARACEHRPMTDAIRTPDELLEDLPGFPWAPRYRQVDGPAAGARRRGRRRAGGDVARRADVGLPVAQGGARRCSTPATASCCPTSPASAAPTSRWTAPGTRTTATSAMAATLLEDLDLRGATFVVHDWGGPIGLRLAVEHRERVDRLVIMDTGLLTGRQEMSDAWHQFADFVRRVEELPIGFLVRRGCHVDPGDEVAAAYDAPFPNEAVEGRRARLPGADPGRARRWRAPRPGSARSTRCARTRGRC